MKKIFLLCLLCLILTPVQSQSYLGWVTSKVNLWEGPNTSHKVIKSLDQGSQIFISSLVENNGYVNIIDIASNTEGFVSKKYVKVGQELEVSSEGILQNMGQTSSYQPEIEIYNNTNLTLTLKMNDNKYSFYSKERRKFNLPSGSYSYTASAPGVIPDIGNERLENNNGYRWEFYIVTR